MKPTPKRYREFTVIFKDPDLNGFKSPNEYLEFINNSDHLKSLLKYLIFQWEINVKNEGFKTFYQMYFEFKDWMSYKRIQTEFFNGINVEVIPRTETQEEAIKKCSDKSKSLVINENFLYGEPRKVYNKYSHQANNDINFNFKEQIINIIEEAERGKYTSLQDIQKDYPILRFTHDALLQKILNSAKSKIKSIKDLSPARVIWVFGEAGAGKTVWTQKYLRSINCEYSKVLEISPPSMVYGEHIWFNLEDQFKKVLIINEADKEFPKRNNLIALIDRKEQLDVKSNPKIDNNFELIIINSIYRPEEVFKYLGKKNAKQVLRRIFNSHKNSCVYKLTPNEKQLKQSEKGDFEMNDLDFQNWYQPNVEKINKADWSLFDKE